MSLVCTGAADSRVEHLIRSTCTVRLDISWVCTGAGTSRLNICNCCLHRKAGHLFGLHRSRIFKVEHHLFLSTQEGSLWSTQVQDLQGWTFVPVYTGKLIMSSASTGPGSSRLNICSCLPRKAGHLFGLHRCRDSRVEYLYQSTQEGWTSLWSTQVKVLQGWIEHLCQSTRQSSRLNICSCPHRKAGHIFGLHRSRIFKVEHLFLSTQECWTYLWSTQVQDLQGWTSVLVYTGRLNISLGSTKVNGLQG